QIVAPDGRVMAMAGKDEDIIYADIDVSQANDKRRPDGTDIFAARNASLYQALADDPAEQDLPAISGTEDVAAASIRLQEHGGEAFVEILQRVQEAQAAGAKLICLPALPGATGIDDTTISQELITAIAGLLADDVYVATSMALDDGAVHGAILIDKTGIVLKQSLMHATTRYRWSSTDTETPTLETRHGKVGILCGDDAIFPEVFRLYAMRGVSIMLIPADFAESWEAATGLVERAAENRINIVAASHADSAASGLIATLQKDFTIMTPWEDREFDGLLSAPVVQRCDDDLLVADIHPLAAANKECSRNTHLINSRPWWLLNPITAQQ
ncbi:MAG: hydrolase, partial [Gammaproteobacteria bacterium]|nr:hydrolase [Gammaproteobacteria bacterium]